MAEKKDKPKCITYDVNGNIIPPKEPPPKKTKPKKRPKPRKSRAKPRRVGRPPKATTAPSATAKPVVEEKVDTREEVLNALELSDEEKEQLLNSNGLSASNLLIPSVYAEVFQDNYKYFCLSSGRLSGKTSILVALWWATINKYRDKDIVVLQATATEIKSSIIVEIQKFLNNSGFDVSDRPTSEWYIPKSRDRIVHRGQKGTTYFYPITDSKGGQRARGVSTGNKLSLILYEEAQKNKDRNVLDQSTITFVRQVQEGAKMVVVGNNETVGHWFIDYVEEKKQDPSWCYIYANCFDIWGLLNPQTQEYVLNYKKANYTEFRRIFLGDIHASTANVVFPQFERSKNYKRATELEPKIIRYLIIGIDHATANDTFAVVPVAILDDGTCQTLEVCYDDPEETQRTLAPTEQCEILDDFLDWLDNRYGIAYNRLKTILSVDGAASPFIAQLRHLKKTSQHKELWRNIDIKAFTIKHKDVNLGIIKNAFAYGVLTILNEGVYQWNGEGNKHRLAREIEAQRYKNGKLDPAIKNDLCDALEYGLVPFYTNCYNLSYPIRMGGVENHYNDIRKLAKLK